LTHSLYTAVMLYFILGSVHYHFSHHLSYAHDVVTYMYVATE